MIHEHWGLECVMREENKVKRLGKAAE